MKTKHILLKIIVKELSMSDLEQMGLEAINYKSVSIKHTYTKTEVLRHYYRSKGIKFVPHQSNLLTMMGLLLVHNRNAMIYCY